MQNTIQMEQFFAALSLIEILCERGMVNQETVKAVRARLVNQQQPQVKAA